MLTLRGIGYNVAGRTILEEVSFKVLRKQHIGVVGRNGSGKSTLFKIIQGTLEPDLGEISIEKNCKISAVQQEMPSAKFTPRDFILSQDFERNELLKELEECSDPNRMSEVYDRLIQINAFDAEARAAVVLKGLGFDEEAQNTPMSAFSGGFRMRVALGAILFQEPDLLLLDEPTNHLDLETTDWLEDFLKKYPKSFMLISHDRDFLNSTADHILHVKQTHISMFTGNFDTFLDVYTMQQKNAEDFNAKMEEKRKHMMDFVTKFRSKATKAKQAQSRLRAISKMKFLPVEKNDRTIEFNFPAPETLPPPIISFDKIALGYDDKIVLKDVSGSIMPEDRIAIVGPNGNGKTTFAKFLAGELKPKKGIRTANPKIKFGFYRQDIMDDLDLELTVFDHMKSIMESLGETQIRAHLGRFGFSGEIVKQKIKQLSGGEKARLVFASLTINAPNVLILDEPTNHLDIEMRESLISTLTSYNGVIILISHDRNFLNRVANNIIIVKNNTINYFNGDLSEYEKDSKSSRK